jgi:peptide/nickel transport system permease protein
LGSILVYIGRRILLALVTVFVVLTFMFVLIHLAPGSILDTLEGTLGITPAYQALIIHEYALDQPLYVQYGAYVWQVLHGNLGYSLIYNQPVADVLVQKLSNTTLLGVAAFAIYCPLGIGLGLYAARRPHSKADNITSLFALIGHSLPSYWLAMLMLLTFGLWLNMFPVSGIFTVGSNYTGFARVGDVLDHLALPAFTVAIGELALISRVTRTGILTVSGEDFITTARSKGLPDRWILRKHIIRNAILPLVTVIGVNLGFLIAGLVFVEDVFSWPGVGLMTINAISNRDYPVIMGAFFALSVAVVLANLAVDVVYAIIDPRIRYR